MTSNFESQSPLPFGAVSVEECERLANDLVLAFDSHDESALQRTNQRYQRSFTFDDLSAEVW